MKFVEDAMVKQEQLSHVAAVVTDCESWMGEADRPLQEKTTTHIGCAPHRLQSSAGIMLTDEGVKNTLSNEPKSI